MSEPTQPGPAVPDSGASSTPEPSTTPPSSPPVSDAPISAREAADLISGKPPEQASANGQDPAADAAPPKESRSETGADEPAEEPPLVPPRSWSKDEKEAFRALPREYQERILNRDRAREADISRAINETAERARAAQALAQQAEQARQAYEAALPQMAVSIDSDYQREFGQPTWDQIQQWASYDQPKYVRWQAAYARAKAVGEELQQRQYQEQQQFQQTAQHWLAEQGKLIRGKVSRVGRPEKDPEEQASMFKHMEDVGFDRREIEGAATQLTPLSIHDNQVQSMSYKSMLYDQAQAAAKRPPLRTVPPVQRPGSAPNRGEANETRLRELNQRLDRTGGAREAAALIAARMRS